MNDYLRRVQYHETDKMGITHHSNYIKWMEEARIDYLGQLGYGYAKLEAGGIVSPVLSVECQYKNPTTFDDTVRIHAFLEAYRGVSFTIGYVMTNEKNGVTVCTGRTSHCFIGADRKPIIIKKHDPAFDAALKAALEASAGI